MFQMLHFNSQIVAQNVNRCHYRWTYKYRIQYLCDLLLSSSLFLFDMYFWKLVGKLWRT